MPLPASTDLAAQGHGRPLMVAGPALLPARWAAARSSARARPWDAFSLRTEDAYTP